MALKVFVKKVTPGFVIRALQKTGVVKSYIPLPRKVELGDLNRTTPLSKVFGYDRGGPVDRYYIENFLNENSGLIHGRVLEIGDNEYTLKFGRDKVIQSDILHVDEKNKNATFIGDLSNAPQLPDNSFDCIVLTQTLHLIYDHIAALKTCYRILKPGGKLLLTVPGISHIDQGEWMDYWLWAYTSASITKMLKEAFLPEKFVIQTHGNVLAATAFLYGMGATELSRKKLDDHDPHYQLIITAVATK
jgi:SAM-dependent methyltransferase